MPSTIRLHRVLKAPPQRVYKAFLDPAAMAKWLPPYGFTCTVHQADPKVGGTHKASFTNFTTGKSHSNALHHPGNQPDRVRAQRAPDQEGQGGLKFLVFTFLISMSGLSWSANKCIVNGKTVYQEAECPRGSVQKPIAERVQSGSGAARTSTGGVWPKLPELQRGQWMVEESGGPSGGSPTCGHPLQSLYSEYDQLAKLREHGCRVDASSPRAGTVQVSADCPANSKIGEVKTTFIVVSPNPTYVSVQYTHKGRQQILSAKRIGDC